MNKFLLVAVLLTCVVGGVWWIWQSEMMIPFQSDEMPRDIIADEVTTSTEQSSETTTKRYTNEEWGFSFELPEKWEVSEGSFSGYYTKEGIQIRAPAERKGLWHDPIILHIVEPVFVENSYKNIVKSETAVMVHQTKAVRYQYSWNNEERIATIVPIKQYQMIIGSDGSFPQEYERILDTFQFLE